MGIARSIVRSIARPIAGAIGLGFVSAGRFPQAGDYLTDESGNRLTDELANLLTA